MGWNILAIGALVAIFGPLATMVAERYMAGAPEWMWRLMAFSCICAGVAIVLLSEPASTILTNPAKYPVKSTVLVAITAAVIAGSIWWFWRTPNSPINPSAQKGEEKRARKDAAAAPAETESLLKLRIFQMKFSQIAVPGEPNGLLPLVVVSAEVRNTGTDPLDCVNWLFEARPAGKPVGPKAQPYTVDEVTLPTEGTKFVKMAGGQQLHRKTYGKAISKNERVAGFIEFRFPGRTIREIRDGGGITAPNTFFLSCVDSSGRTASISRREIEVDGVAPQLWPGIEYLPGSDGSKQEYTVE